MAIVLQRLQRVLDQSNSTADDPVSIEAYFNEEPRVFSSPRTQAIFKLLVEEDASLVLEYNMLRLLLQNTLKARNAELDAERKQALDKDSILLVREALRLSTLLDRKYCHYINDRPNLRKSQLENHQVLYRRWLHVHENHHLLHGCQTPHKVDMPLADEIRSLFDASNRYRLGALRCRRLLIALIPILNNFQQYGPWIRWLDLYAAPTLSYVNLFFFLPRLTLNAYTLASHWIEHESMSPEERSLGSTARFNAQWERLWPNLTNDIAWAGNAALTFFVFTGSLQPYGVYLGLTAQLYDLVLSSVRGYEELCRLNGLEQQYQELQASDPNYSQAEAYLVLLKKRIQREREFLLLSMVNFTVLFFVAVLAFPSIAALSPWVPVLGSGMSVVMTGLNFWWRDYLMPAGARELDLLLTCEMPEETPRPQQQEDDLLMWQNSAAHEEPLVLRRARSSNALLSDHPAGFISNLRRRSVSLSGLDDPMSPVTVSASLSHARLRANQTPNKDLLTTTSREDFFFSDVDANPGSSVRL
jgi:hypothetical protein